MLQIKAGDRVRMRTEAPQGMEFAWKSVGASAGKEFTVLSITNIGENSWIEVGNNKSFRVELVAEILKGSGTMTKEEFDNRYAHDDGNKVVVSCTTIEQARELLRLAHSFGYKWVSGGSLLSKDGWWQRYKTDTCYKIARGGVSFCNRAYFVKSNCKIVPYAVQPKEGSGEMEILILEGKYGIWVARAEDLSKGIELPLFKKGGELYDDDLRNTQSGSLLRVEYRDACNTELPLVRKKLMEIAELYSRQPKPAEKPAPKRQVQFSIKMPEAPQPQASPLEQALLNSMAQLNSDAIIKQMMPSIDAFIKAEYGIKPEVMVIKRPDQTEVKITGVVHKKFKPVLSMVQADIPVMLTGQAGTGKNHLVKQVSDAMSLDFYFTNAVTQEYKLTGFIDAMGKFHETEFYKAFTKGGIFMLDEMDASIPETLVILNAAIANRYFDFPNGRVDAHTDFRVIAAANTFGTGADSQYVGRFQLDAATLDRFSVVELEYDERVEDAMAGGNQELVTFARLLRKAFEKTGLDKVISYRGIEMVRKLEGHELPTKDVLQYTMLKGLRVDDIKQVINSITIDSKYKQAMQQLCEGV